MPYVLTVDQAESRRRGDIVDAAIQSLSVFPARLPFERTAGDEFQGLLEDPSSVVDAILVLMREERWHVGLGIGAVETPLPGSTRAGRGIAFVAARSAVDQAKRAPFHLSIQAPEAPDQAADAQVVFRLLAALRSRRTEQGWQAVELMNQWHSMTRVAQHLGVTRQAVGQRLAAAQWSLESETLPVLHRLLGRADRQEESR